MKLLRNRQGAALIETAMCIPLFACILVGTMFLGWAMMHQQQVKTSARYVSWRYANTEPTDLSLIGLNLNQMFFRDEGINIGTEINDGEGIEEQDLVDASNNQSSYAREFADRLLINPYADQDFFPRACEALISAGFGSDIDAFKKYTGTIKGYHIRDGVEWRRSEVNCIFVTRQQFLLGLDQVLISVPEPGTEMGKMIQETYTETTGW